MFSSPKASIEGENLEFFQVPKPTVGGGGSYSSKASEK